MRKLIIMTFLLSISGPRTQLFAKVKTGDANNQAVLDVSKAKAECLAGHLGVCVRLGHYYNRLGQTENAERYWEPACDGDDHNSCIKLADGAEHRGDQKKMMRWLRRACRTQKDDGTGCFRMAALAENMGSKENAKIWYKKACDKKFKLACDKLEQ